MTSPMTPSELAGWTAQQSARRERPFTRAPDGGAARCPACGAARRPRAPAGA